MRDYEKDYANMQNFKVNTYFTFKQTLVGINTRHLQNCLKQ